MAYISDKSALGRALVALKSIQNITFFAADRIACFGESLPKEIMEELVELSKDRDLKYLLTLAADIECGRIK